MNEKCILGSRNYEDKEELAFISALKETIGKENIHIDGKITWLILFEDENFNYCVSDKLLCSVFLNGNKRNGTEYSKSEIRKY